MHGLEPLIRLSGRWVGTSRLQDPKTSGPDESASVCRVSALLGGRFVRVDYSWAYHGDPHEGSLLYGYERATAVVTAVWIDSWHLGEKFMRCHGVVEKSGIVTDGVFEVIGAPERHWRTVIGSADGASLRIIMYDVAPDGTRELAVEAVYTRGE